MRGKIMGKTWAMYKDKNKIYLIQRDAIPRAYEVCMIFVLCRQYTMYVHFFEKYVL